MATRTVSAGTKAILTNVLFEDLTNGARFVLIGALEASLMDDAVVEDSETSNIVRLTGDPVRLYVLKNALDESNRGFRASPLIFSPTMEDPARYVPGDPMEIGVGRSIQVGTGTFFRLLVEADGGGSDSGSGSGDSGSGDSGSGDSGSGSGSGSDSRITPPVAESKSWPTWKWLLLGAGIAGAGIVGYKVYKHYRDKG